MQEFKPKHFRLLKPELLNLNKNKVYLATETPTGYVIKLDDGDWMGFPKSIVENAGKMFRLYSKDEHREYRRFKQRKRIVLTRKQTLNHVQIP